ncbi:MAG: nuclear transport factor 2 family protein [Cyclobacteriaceae bacterium]
MYSENDTLIKETIRNYFDGLFYGDIAKLKIAFAEDCYLHGDIKNIPYKKQLDEYFESVQNRKSPDELREIFRMDIISIEVLGRIAIAKLHVPMLGYNYYDFLSRALINGRWKIAHKLFVHI